MDRGSSKHGQRFDDELERESLDVTEGSPGGESRVEEWRDLEPSGEDEPDVSLVPEIDAGEEGGAPTGMSPADRERRARLGQYLRRSIFPATKQQLVDEARHNSAPDAVIDELARLSESAEYPNVARVWSAMVGVPESRLEERF